VGFELNLSLDHAGIFNGTAFHVTASSKTVGTFFKFLIGVPIQLLSSTRFFQTPCFIENDFVFHHSRLCRTLSFIYIYIYILLTMHLELYL
jgi:hypothetical protein